MAYFLEPLIKFLDQILQPDQHKSWILDHNRIPEIESLLEKAIFLRDYLANSAGVSDESTEHLEDKIRDAVESAEDILESHIADQVSSSRGGRGFTISPPDLQKVIQEFDSAKDEMLRIMDGARILYSESSAVPSSSDPNPKKIFVGFTEDLTELKDRVTDWSSKLEIIPIVGMGGMGKTTLAQIIYDDPSVVSNFDVLAWITISQDYSVRGVLLGLLSCIIGKHSEETLQMKDNGLGVALHQRLMGRRYLIVLDDIWHPKVWDDLKKFLPNEHNGSRVILTTRESNVGTYMDPKSSHHQMHLLSDDDSWELLRKKVYGEEACPPELEEIGIRIASSCRGLPLSIHVIGGLLTHATRTPDSWEQVAKGVKSIVANKDDQFSRIFSLSYNHLPHHLKPCFLYMSAFPEDYEIPATKLVRLWVAEGFLRPIENKSLEEAAEVYINALVDRNLILIHKQEINGKVKLLGVHDLLRDLCVRKAREKKFMYVKNRQVENIQEETTCMRRVSVHTSYRIRDIYGSMELMSLARTFLCIGPASRVILSPFFFTSRLLRELDVVYIEFPQFPEEFLQLVNLRYLAFSSTFGIPKRISRLTNLQTLVIRLVKVGYVTTSVFNMPQLRHIKLIGQPGWFTKNINFGLQENLQSLYTVKQLEMDLANIPNLKKLGIYFDNSSAPSMVRDLTCLHKLEALKCSTDLSPGTKTFLSELTYPPSLKKLSLSDCTILSTCMNTIGMLPNLEILKLQNCTFENPNWEPSEGEFSKLMFLLLEQLNLVNWTADQYNFPTLRHLIIRNCSEIEEISTDLGEIPTLEIIEVDESSPNVAATARKILEEQRDNGNELLQVRISASHSSSSTYS